MRQTLLFETDIVERPDWIYDVFFGGVLMARPIGLPQSRNEVVCFLSRPQTEIIKFNMRNQATVIFRSGRIIALGGNERV
jgi:hypothetical protein